jgi:hypothetical protein
MGGPGADSEEKHEPVSDIETVVVDSLKALDPEWPIREADLLCSLCVLSIDPNRTQLGRPGNELESIMIPSGR